MPSLASLQHFQPNQPIGKWDIICVSSKDWWLIILPPYGSDHSYVVLSSYRDWSSGLLFDNNHYIAKIHDPWKISYMMPMHQWKPRVFCNTQCQQGPSWTENFLRRVLDWKEGVSYMHSCVHCRKGDAPQVNDSMLYYYWITDRCLIMAFIFCL